MSNLVKSRKNWLLVAKAISTFSKDPSSQVGAVIVNQSDKLVGIGYNGFPKKIRDEEHLLNSRPEKLKRIIHAEMNAIFDAKTDLNGCTIYVWPYFPCPECFKNIIQVGIIRVVACEFLPSGRYPDAFNTLRELAEESGVFVDKEEFQEVSNVKRAKDASGLSWKIWELIGKIFR